MTVCPKCKMRVFPKADGTCPSCGAMLKSAAKTRSANKAKSEPSPKKQHTARQSKSAGAELSKPPKRVSRSLAGSFLMERGRNFNYGEVLLKSAKIIWMNKRLWIPAILLFAIISLYSNIGTLLGLSSQAQIKNVSSMSPVLTSILFIAVIVLFVSEITLSFGYPIIVSQGAFQVDQGLKISPFMELVRSIKIYFWRIFGLSFLLGFIAMMAFLPVFCIFIFLNKTWISDPQAITSHAWVIYIIGFILMTIISGLFAQPLFAVILENKDVSDALSRGWKIYTHFFGKNLLMGLILCAISYGVTFLFTLPQKLFIPQIQSILTGSTLDTATILIYSGIAIIYWILYSVILGIVATYVQSAWTLTFLRLTRPASAKLSNA